MRFTWSVRAGEQLLRLDAEVRDRFFTGLEEELVRREGRTPRPRGSRESGIVTVSVPGIARTRVRRFRRTVRIISIQPEPGVGES